MLRARISRIVEVWVLVAKNCIGLLGRLPLVVLGRAAVCSCKGECLFPASRSDQGVKWQKTRSKHADVVVQSSLYGGHCLVDGQMEWLG